MQANLERADVLAHIGPVLFEPEARSVVSRFEGPSHKNDLIILAGKLLDQLQRQGGRQQEAFVVSPTSGSIEGVSHLGDGSRLAISIAPYVSLQPEDLKHPVAQVRYLTRLSELLYRALHGDQSESLEVRLTIAQIGGAAHAKGIDIKDATLLDVARRHHARSSSVQVRGLPTDLAHAKSSHPLDFDWEVAGIIQSITQSVKNDLQGDLHDDRFDEFRVLAASDVRWVTDALLDIVRPRTSLRLWKRGGKGLAEEASHLCHEFGERLVALVDSANKCASLDTKIAERREPRLIDDPRLLVHRLFKAMPYIRAAVQEDIDVTFEADPAAPDRHEVEYSYPGPRALAIYRCANELYHYEVPFLARMFAEDAHERFGIDIHPGASICAGVSIDHGTGLTIGETAKVGKYCKLYQGITLGAWKFERDGSGNLIRGGRSQRHPTLGEGVEVYANATILGGSTVIGRYSIIGANTRVEKSLDPRMVAYLKDGRTLVKSRNDI